jgi:hypothetical protein
VLARELGMTVAELLGRMSAREFVAWQAFMRVEAEEARRAELAAKAETGLKARRKRAR